MLGELCSTKNILRNRKSKIISLRADHSVLTGFLHLHRILRNETCQHEAGQLPARSCFDLCLEPQTSSFKTCTARHEHDTYADCIQEGRTSSVLLARIAGGWILVPVLTVKADVLTFVPTYLPSIDWLRCDLPTSGLHPVAQLSALTHHSALRAHHDPPTTSAREYECFRYSPHFAADLRRRRSTGCPMEVENIKSWPRQSDRIITRELGRTQTHRE